MGHALMKQSAAAGNAKRDKHTGNNGKILLWQFLLNHLLKKEYYDKIRWLVSEQSEEGVFLIADKVAVAALWRRAKGKHEPSKTGECHSLSIPLLSLTILRLDSVNRFNISF